MRSACIHAYAHYTNTRARTDKQRELRGRSLGRNNAQSNENGVDNVQHLQ